MSFNSPRRLTAEQFDAAVPVLQAKRKRISDDRIEAARRTMVLGEKADDVASSYGWSRNAVSICVRKVWDVAEQMRLDAETISAEGHSTHPVYGETDVLPSGWHRRTFVAPEHLLNKWAGELESLFNPPLNKVAPVADKVVAKSSKKLIAKKAASVTKTKTARVRGN